MAGRRNNPTPRYLVCFYCSLMYVGSACCLTGANSVLSLCRHWCHYTVTRTVSCQVQNGSETVIQRVYQSCRWPGPCANLVSYRTLIRPTYKMSYRTVTTLEWRCCPGFTGSNCEEGKLSSNGHVLHFPSLVFCFNCYFWGFETSPASPSSFRFRQ
uniref:EMI domain-containing protein n=1 Tax=Accipiter nisus TaxID=211598 RepID=A0A8B9N5T6_9AVES